MANLNVVHLIGRLGRDPEVRMFANGGKVASFSICVNNRKKDSSTGQWVDDPCWLDCSAFNRGEHGKLADLCEQYLRKGHQAYIQGHLTQDKWTQQDGTKREKIKVIVDSVQFLEPKREGSTASPRQESRPAQSQDGYESPPPAGDGDIPF